MQEVPAVLTLGVTAVVAVVARHEWAIRRMRRRIRDNRRVAKASVTAARDQMDAAYCDLAAVRTSGNRLADAWETGRTPGAECARQLREILPQHEEAAR
jgi:hypothetical protein